MNKKIDRNKKGVFILKITNIFDAAREGTYEEFVKFYNGNVNIISENLGLNLLSLTLVNDKNCNEKIKIINFLISKDIDIKFVDNKNKRNALHIFYFSVLKPSSQYMLDITKILVKAGVDINGLDRYNAIPLKYALTITKKPTCDIKSIYRYLLEQGSKYKHKDIFGKSCLNYANEYSWRNDFTEIVKEFEDENK